MDFGLAFNYPRRDPQWLSKVFMCALWSILIVTSPAVLGFVLEAARRVARNEDELLPSWEGNFGAFWMDGLRLCVTIFVYNLPNFVIQMIGVCIGVAMAVGSQDGNSGGAAIGLFSMLAQVFNVLWAVVLAALTPAIYVMLMEENGWGAGFRFGRLRSIVFDRIGTYIIAALFMFILGLLGSFGVVLCVVGALITIPYCQLAGAHICGQLARECAADYYKE